MNQGLGDGQGGANVNGVDKEGGGWDSQQTRMRMDKDEVDRHEDWDGNKMNINKAGWGWDETLMAHRDDGELSRREEMGKNGLGGRKVI